MTANFPQVGLHDLFDGSCCFRFFSQNHLTDNSINVGIGEFHPDGEAPLQSR